MAKRKRRASRSSAVRPGIVAAALPVPARIVRPPYVLSPGGEPGLPRMSLVRTDKEIEAMRRAGSIAAEVLMAVGGLVAPGVTTDALDQAAHEEAIARGAYPSPLGYRGFPKSICTSVNEVICHGIPDSRPLAEGDILNIDVTVYVDGVHGDTSSMFYAGEPDGDSRRLVQGTRDALFAAIEAVRPGAEVCSIGKAVDSVARPLGLGVVREFVGHSVGTDFHGRLQIPHYYDSRNDERLPEGATFTIEPMLTLGRPSVDLWDDNWTAVTLDGSRSAQFEHTLLVTAEGVEILTLDPQGRSAHDAHSAWEPASLT